ncbi:MAG TPA: MBL fold metallo-hydrolase [Rubricoccaceae bacterium]|nr:MBL fold metallo-hydrolase [Rubricoccaceae bacterium]
MRYLSLGDTDEIAASCHYLELAGTGLVLDAGMDPDADGPAAVPPFELLDRYPVDHVIISHAHHDHLGSLPVLLRRIPHARVHLSKPTLLLADVLLPHSAKLQKRRLREGSTAAEPIFDVETVEALSYLYEAHNLDTDLDLSGLHATSPLTMRFYHAGHVLGAVGVYLEAREKDAEGVPRLRRVFYTSDTSVSAQTLQPGGDYPEGPLDVLLLETTLGADPEAERTTRRAEEQAFGEGIAAVLARGGSVLVPVFALGRAQEVLALIDRYKRRGLLPDETPVYTAGSARALAAVYDQTRFHSPRLDPGFEVVNVEQERLPTTQARLSEALSEPAIYVLPSGMLFERTASNQLAQRLVGSERNAVFFVGFAKEDTPGGRLLEAAAAGPGTEVQLDPLAGPQAVHAEVRRFRFSGHAHRRDLLRLVEMMRPKTLVLVHGETAAKEWVKDNVEDQFPDVRVLIPRQGEEIAL